MRRVVDLPVDPRAINPREIPWHRFLFFPRLFLLTHRRSRFNGTDDKNWGEDRLARIVGVSEMSHDESEIYARLFRDE